MKNAWPDSWCAEINGLNWSDNKIEPIEGVYQRCMYIVATSNEFLRNIDNAPAEINKVQYRAEARFCRALAYSVLLDMFGRPPFVDENYNAQPAQKTRAELFDWVISELQDIRENLPGQRACYGRADKGADDFLQARLFLNAEVYTGTARYSDCIEACKRVMDGGYKLASNYADLFRADNGENPDTKQEIIFPVCFDGITAKSYGMGALVLGSRSSSDFGDVVTYPDGLRAASGVNGGWDGYRSTQNLTNKFEYADAENKNPSNILDKRGIFNDHNGGCSQNITTAVKGTFTTEGWAVYKYTNITSKGLNGKDMAFPDTDFPMFRLGDVYLMYAEAVARGGQGLPMSEAVRLVNEPVPAVMVTTAVTSMPDGSHRTISVIFSMSAHVSFIGKAHAVQTLYVTDCSHLPATSGLTRAA